MVVVQRLGLENGALKQIKKHELSFLSILLIYCHNLSILRHSDLGHF